MAQNSMPFIMAAMDSVFKDGKTQEQLALSLKQLRLRKLSVLKNSKDSGSIKALRPIINLEKRYLQMIMYKFHQIQQSVQNLSPDLALYFDGSNEYTAFVSQASMLFLRINELFAVMQRRIHSEERIVNRWAGSHSFFWPKSAGKVQQLLSEDTQALMKLYSDDAHHIKVHLHDIYEALDSFKQRSSILLEKQIKRSDPNRQLSSSEERIKVISKMSEQLESMVNYAFINSF